MTADRFPPETNVPPGESPAGRCPHCDRPFRTDRAYALHLGDRHESRLTPDERAAYEAATEAEADELFGYHAKVVVALGGIYSILVILYMIAFGVGFV